MPSWPTQNTISSSINSIAALCEATGADVQELARAIGTDSRLRSKFLKAGPGFGGSYFQKEVLNLTAGGEPQHLATAQHQRPGGAAALWHRDGQTQPLCGRLRLRRAGCRVWPPADCVHKADINETRETPAIRICRNLLVEGAQLAIFDPKVSAEQIGMDLGGEALVGSEGEGMQGEGVWQPVADPCAAVAGTDAVLLLTNWQQFRQLDWPAMAALMRQPAWLFEARTVTDVAAVRAAGLRVGAVGEGEG